MNVLFCVLNKDKFNQISTYDTVYDIWYNIEVIDEGTYRVNEYKINLLIYNYELFKIKLIKSINEMYAHFTDKWIKCSK